jgi:hypothetical protein
MKVTISAFFGGTDHKISYTGYLASLLNKYVDTSSTDQKNIGFDGCGVTSSFWGGIFGVGLDKQSLKVIKMVQAEIEKGNTVTLNAYGHSRGAIGAQLLAKQLGEIDPKLLEINLGLLDPVSGNLITTSTLDQFNISLAKKTMDLRDCKPLKKVLVLYPHEPLLTIAAHAPLISLYPEHTEVEEDVIAGCHAEAQFQREQEQGSIQFTNPESFISFARFYQFFKKAGTQFKSINKLNILGYDENLDFKDVTIDELNEALKRVYTYVNSIFNGETYRDCHSATGLRINTKKSAPYFNLHHQRLEGVDEDKSKARVTFEKNYGPVSLIKRAMHHYPISWQLLKWMSIGLGIATILFFTGALPAIPFLAPLGVLSIFIVAPIVSLTVATLWYGVVKPVSQWAISRIFYPDYKIRTFYPPKRDVDNFYKLMNALEDNNTNVESVNNTQENNQYTQLYKKTSNIINIDDNNSELNEYIKYF